MKTAESKTCALCPEPPHEDWRELQPGVTHRSDPKDTRQRRATYTDGGRIYDAGGFGFAPQFDWEKIERMYRGRSA